MALKIPSRVLANLVKETSGGVVVDEDVTVRGEGGGRVSDMVVVVM